VRCVVFVGWSVIGRRELVDAAMLPLALLKSGCDFDVRCSDVGDASLARSRRHVKLGFSVTLRRPRFSFAPFRAGDSKRSEIGRKGDIV